MSQSNATPADDELNKFTTFMRELVSVPHDEIKARIKAEKGKKRTSKTTSSPAPAASASR